MSDDKTTVQSAAQALIDDLEMYGDDYYNGERLNSSGYNLKESLKKALEEEAKTTNIQIQFANKKVADHFCNWLCWAGEQDYWTWMECREGEEDGDITAIEFNYHGKEDETKAKNDPERYGEFMCDGIIRTECGRLDEDE
jgi:hypothetical protein